MSDHKESDDPNDENNNPADPPLAEVPERKQHKQPTVGCTVRNFLGAVICAALVIGWIFFLFTQEGGADLFNFGPASSPANASSVTTTTTPTMAPAAGNNTTSNVTEPTTSPVVAPPSNSTTGNNNNNATDTSSNQTST